MELPKPPTDRCRTLLVKRPSTDPAGRSACLEALSAADAGSVNLLRITRSESPSDWLRFWRTEGDLDVADHRIVMVRPEDGLRCSAGTTTASRAGTTDVSMPEPESDVSVTVVPTDDDTFHQLQATVADVLDDWADADSPPLVCGGSVVGLLETVDPDGGLRSLQQLLDHLRAAGARVHFHIDPERVTDADCRALDRVFDRIVGDPQAVPPAPAPEASPDVVFELLGHDCRREVVRLLGAMEEPIGVDELASRVGQRRGGPESTRVAPERKTKVDLYHNHLPKLADAGVVSFDREAGTVRPERDITPMLRVLDRLPG
jgi:predicted transcriptional regulator